MADERDDYRLEIVVSPDFCEMPSDFDEILYPIKVV